MIPITNYENYQVSESGEVWNTNTGKALKATINKVTGYLYVSLWKNNEGKTVSVHRLVAFAYIPNPESKPFVNHKNSIRTDASKGTLEWCTQSENICHGYDFGFMNQDHRKHFEDFELEIILNTVLDGESMTAIANQKGVGLSRLTINVRKRAENLGSLEEFENALREQKKIRNTQANEDKKQPIIQSTKEGIFIYEHESLTAAAKSLGKTSGSISNALNPKFKQHTAYGFLWKFK